MKCPICDGRKPADVLFCCSHCWYNRVSASDRTALATMLINKQPTDSKLAAVVRQARGAR